MNICLDGYFNNMLRSCAICCIEKTTPNYPLGKTKCKRAFLYTSSLVSQTCMFFSFV